ncbi:MAG TPA: hypothetical protein VMR70_04845 [Flavisolibacter sp.]|nr:hypothetical protein [Flavisolibacter sp.]
MRNPTSRFFLILVFVVSTIVAHSQKQSLTTKLNRADSVFLVSHKSVPGSSIVEVDSLGKEISFPLFVDGRLNENSVQEKVLLDATEIKIGKDA